MRHTPIFFLSYTKFLLIRVRIIGRVLNGLNRYNGILAGREHYGHYTLTTIKGNNPVINVLRILNLSHRFVRF